MTFTKVLAAAALVTAMATPVFAQEIPYGADGHTGQHTKWTGNYGGYNRGYYNRGYGPGEVAAGIVGGAIGTAAAIAGAPGYYGDSYAYEPVYNEAPSYAVRQNGFVCQPGTYYRNSYGHTQFCQ